MTEETEARESIVFDEFLVSLLEANARQSAAVQHSVEGNLQREIEEWKEAYVGLWDLMAEVADRIDSAALEALLRMTSYQRHKADQPGYWQTPEWKEKWG